MLVVLRIRNFAIIDVLELELGPGMNVITGETGAGKSIVIHALELLLGGKSSGDVVRTGEEAAEIEALFDIARAPERMARLAAAGIDGDEQLLLRRVIHASGRSRAYVNGAMATVKQLSEIAAGLADISSQHEHHSLVDPDRHLEYLDAFGGLDEARRQMADAYRAAADAQKDVAALTTVLDARAEREALLRFQLKEIEDLDPKQGELEALIEEREKLRHAARLIETGARAEQLLYADDGALSEVLGRVADDVRKAAEVDSSLGGAAGALEQALSLVEDAAKELGRYARGFELDPERVGEVEERTEKLKRLERKYGPGVEGILQRRRELEAELDGLVEVEDRLARATQARDAALDAAARHAMALRRERAVCAKKLGEAIGKELESLGMGDARVEMNLSPLEGGATELSVDGARLTATGIDHAELLIAPNRGEETRPLRRIASGGELSRALLAIKRVLSMLRPAGLYVFDEVDTGVGGAVAEAIGEKVADVARSRQVLCISHLPQVAAFGEPHFQVRKEVVGDRTRSTIRRLTPAERLEELARMLGGKEITAATRAAAGEMLAAASKTSRAEKPRRRARATG
jgi:DNA repair protein RecN (Recombination protein N)